MEKLTKLQIIEETIDYYSADTTRRAFNSELGFCMYLLEDGKQCAVGRCLQQTSPKLLDYIGGVEGMLAQVYKQEYDGVDEYGCPCFYPEHIINEPLHEKYHGHELCFWEALQDLHDTAHYWDHNGLTTTGVEYVQKIKKIYSSLKQL